MSVTLYIPDGDAWKKYFANPPSSDHKKFYTIQGKAQQHGENLDGIKLVTPTAQVIQQARATMERIHKSDEFECPKKRKKSAAAADPKRKKPTVSASSRK